METQTFPARADGVIELHAGDPRATTCGTCGRAWDDSVSTGSTPAPAGRCPFEAEHLTYEPGIYEVHGAWSASFKVEPDGTIGPFSLENADTGACLFSDAETGAYFIGADDGEELDERWKFGEDVPDASRWEALAFGGQLVDDVAARTWPITDENQARLVDAAWRDAAGAIRRLVELGDGDWLDRPETEIGDELHALADAFDALKPEPPDLIDLDGPARGYDVVTVDGKAALKAAQCDCGDIGGPNCVAP